MFEWIFRTFCPKMEVFEGQNRGRVVRCWPPSELVLTFGGCYRAATFGKSRSRNATIDRQTDKRALWHRQTEFI